MAMVRRISTLGVVLAWAGVAVFTGCEKNEGDGETEAAAGSSTSGGDSGVAGTLGGGKAGEGGRASVGGGSGTGGAASGGTPSGGRPAGGSGGGLANAGRGGSGAGGMPVKCPETSDAGAGGEGTDVPTGRVTWCSGDCPKGECDGTFVRCDADYPCDVGASTEFCPRSDSDYCLAVVGSNRVDYYIVTCSDGAPRFMVCDGGCGTSEALGSSCN